MEQTEKVERKEKVVEVPISLFNNITSYLSKAPVGQVNAIYNQLLALGDEFNESQK